jgi:hypothetical protein
MGTGPDQLLIMLEDDRERLDRFSRILFGCVPRATLLHWRSAHEFIAEYPRLPESPRLIALDHALFVDDPNDPDPGDGRDVAVFLTTQPPNSPIPDRATPRDRRSPNWGKPCRLRKENLMTQSSCLTRRDFLASSAAGAALAATAFIPHSGGPPAAWAASNGQDEARLKSWDLVQLPGLTMRPDREGRKWALRITAANGAVGVMPVRSCRGFSDTTVQILKTHNLLDHQRLFDVMAERQVTADQLKAADILCWDLRARMIDYAQSHPPLVINLHWAWMPHAHLAMACDEKLMPLAEFPMGEDFPKSILDGPHLLAPDWPRIYNWEAT